MSNLVVNLDSGSKLAVFDNGNKTEQLLSCNSSTFAVPKNGQIVGLYGYKNNGYLKGFGFIVAV